MSLDLARALKRIEAGEIPASSLGVKQRRALDRFISETGGAVLERRGGGAVYRAKSASVISTHLARYRDDPELAAGQRAANLASNGSTKTGATGLGRCYPILRAVGGASWWNGTRRLSLTPDGEGAVGAMPIDAATTWTSKEPLWLVENQAMLEDLSWLPTDEPCSVMWYSGRLHGLVLGWLSRSQVAPRLFHFPDYDGVGLAEHARLQAAGVKCLGFHLAPGWTELLAKRGSRELWEITRRFAPPADTLSGAAAVVHEALAQSGKALEQEAAFLRSDHR
ncbi:hypothetical protein [Palleronia sp.]|uniref:hypothetical protein n=1 Tax=Palleronia sp. TaxID=1940284 RepID=UPI0035C8211A